MTQELQTQSLNLHQQLVMSPKIPQIFSHCKQSRNIQVGDIKDYTRPSKVSLSCWNGLMQNTVGYMGFYKILDNPNVVSSDLMHNFSKIGCGMWNNAYYQQMWDYT